MCCPRLETSDPHTLSLVDLPMESQLCVSMPLQHGLARQHAWAKWLVSCLHVVHGWTGNGQCCQCQQLHNVVVLTALWRRRDQQMQMMMVVHVHCLKVSVDTVEDSASAGSPCPCSSFLKIASSLGWQWIMLLLPNMLLTIALTLCPVVHLLAGGAGVFLVRTKTMHPAMQADHGASCQTPSWCHPSTWWFPTFGPGRAHLMLGDIEMLLVGLGKMCHKVHPQSVHWLVFVPVIDGIGKNTGVLQVLQWLHGHQQLH